MQSHWLLQKARNIWRKRKAAGAPHLSGWDSFALSKIARTCSHSSLAKQSAISGFLPVAKSCSVMSPSVTPTIQVNLCSGGSFLYSFPDIACADIATNIARMGSHFNTCMVFLSVGLTPELTGAGGPIGPQGTNIGHKNREAMANVGVRVERFVRLGREGREE
jgi:hypothetical protein